MDMPTIFELFGLRFFFFSEDQEPIHVHVVKGGEDDAKISLEPTIDVVYNHGLKPKDLKRALQLAEMYKEDIIDVWNKYHS